MASALCDTCQQIPAEFFCWPDEGLSPRKEQYQSREIPIFHHLPLDMLTQSAASGCPLCILLSDVRIQSSSWSNSSWDKIAQGPVVLKHIANIIHSQLSTMSVFVDQEYGRYYEFCQAPPSWDHLPLAQLDKPNSDLELMKAWIDDCVQNHPNCRVARKSFLPTRLLDLMAFKNSADVKLVMLDSKDAKPDYVALSHCWGPPSKQPLVTTMDNLHERMERLCFEEMSLTFQDAILTARSLDQRYLWIDSLCIIQDDEDDWKHEASAMASVYGGSLFTLAALSSESGSDGCRINASGHSSINVSRYLDLKVASHRIRLFDSKPKGWDLEYRDDNPLTTRCWAFQERALSVRSIHFSKNMLLWECRTVKGSSELPWCSIGQPAKLLPRPIKNHILEDATPGGSLLLRGQWYSIIENYSSRNLTMEKDKLPALAGLAAEFEQHFGRDDYLFGLWRCHLPSALLWESGAGEQPRRPGSYRAPSWSCASVDGKISYRSQREWGFSSKLVETNADYDFGEFRVISSQMRTPDYVDSNAELENALQIFGSMISTKVNGKIQYGGGYGYNGWLMLELQDGSPVGATFPDVWSELLGRADVFCLSVRAEPFWNLKETPEEIQPSHYDRPDLIRAEPRMVMGLALIKDSRYANTYRRVGLIRWVKQSVFADVEPTVFSLI